MTKGFGGFYRETNNQLASPDFDFLRTSFQEYLAIYWDGGYVWPNRYSEAVLDKRVFVSTGDAGAKLGIKLAWVHSLIKVGLLRTVNRQRKNVRHTLIEAKSLNELLSNFSGIKPTTAERDTLASSTSLDLAGAVKVLKRCNMGIGQFVKCVLAGDIIPCSETSKEGIDRFLYEKKQVMDYLRVRLKYFRGDSENNLCVLEAAKLMGLNTQGTYFLVEKNFIASQHTIGSKRKNVLVTRETIEHFNSTYISSVKLAKQMHVGSQYLVELLMSHNIKPISGRKIDGGIQYIFKRSDLTNVSEIVSVQMPKIKFICRPETHESLLIDVTGTADILGLNRRAVIKLIENGVLRRLRYRLKDKRRKETSLFNRITVEKLSRENVDLTQLILLSVAARRLNVDSSSFNRKWIRTKKLPYIELKSIPRRRFLLRKDVEALIDHLEVTAHEKKEYLTSQQAARLLGISPGTVLLWEKAGKLHRASEYNANGKMSPLYSVSHVMSIC
jgi:hypothetical protein